MNTDLPRYARAWLESERFPDAAARLRGVAPGPVETVDAESLFLVLGLSRSAASSADVLGALVRSAEAHPDEDVRRALTMSVDVAMDSIYP